MQENIRKLFSKITYFMEPLYKSSDVSEDQKQASSEKSPIFFNMYEDLERYIVPRWDALVAYIGAFSSSLVSTEKLSDPIDNENKAVLISFPRYENFLTKALKKVKDFLTAVENFHLKQKLISSFEERFSPYVASLNDMIKKWSENMRSSFQWMDHLVIGSKVTVEEKETDLFSEDDNDYLVFETDPETKTKTWQKPKSTSSNPYLTNQDISSNSKKYSKYASLFADCRGLFFTTFQPIAQAIGKETHRVVAGFRKN